MSVHTFSCDCSMAFIDNLNCLEVVERIERMTHDTCDDCHQAIVVRHLTHITEGPDGIFFRASQPVPLREHARGFRQRLAARNN